MLARTQPLKIRRLGNSLGAIIPKEVLEQMNLAEGDYFCIVKSADGMQIKKISNPDFVRQLEKSRDVINRYRNALQELA